VTTRAHPPVPVSGAIVTFQAGGNVTMDAYWAGVNAYRAQVPAITSAGGMSAAIYLGGAFELWPLFLPNGTTAQIDALLKPFLAKLDELQIPYTHNVMAFPDFFSAYQALENSALFAIQNTQQGGRLLPKSLYSSPDQLTTLDDTIRKMIDDGNGAFDMSVAPKQAWDHPPNAVLPAWRDAQANFVVFR
jgi:hypothetical protein